MQGVLYLVPNTLGSTEPSWTIPEAVPRMVRSIRIFIVEDLRSARRYLKQLDRNIEIDSLTFYELNEHTPEAEVPAFLEEVRKGNDAAVITEAGVPGVADPGTLAVRLAHRAGIRVVPLTGPSSILLSLMASGLNGQAFRFHGYLPVKRQERIRKIRELEQEVKRTGETQVFIEAPYRNDGLLSDLLAQCDPGTELCVAADLTLESEYIRTRSIAAWKKDRPTLHRRPAIFLLGK
jgi:16S rRNA (cytidine1402-2'-O)-methyltransferase